MASFWYLFCPDLDQSIFKPRYTFPEGWRICFHMASFGRLSVKILIMPFSNPDTHPKSYGIFASRWLHLDAFLSRSGSSQFRAQVHFPKAMAELLPVGFIWIPFCPDLDQAIFEPRYTLPKVWQICFQMVSFGHISVQIWIRPFSSPDTFSQS